MASTLDNAKPSTSSTAEVGFRPSPIYTAANIITVQPPRRQDLQPSYAQTLQGESEDAGSNGWYGSMSMWFLLASLLALFVLALFVPECSSLLVRISSLILGCCFFLRSFLSFSSFLTSLLPFFPLLPSSLLLHFRALYLSFLPSLL